MENISYFVFIFVLLISVNLIENITDQNTNRIKFISSNTFERMLEGCLTGRWGCFGMPRGCIQNKKCKMLATYETSKSSGDVKFTLIGNVDINKYLAIGLSTDNQMGDDAVVFCYNENGKPGIGMAWNWRYGSTIIDDDKYFLKHKYVIYEDQWLYCEFTLMKRTQIVVRRRGVTQNQYLQLDQPYYLQLAKGKKGKGELTYHDDNKITTQKEIYLNRTIADNVTEGKSNPIIKAHGSLMVISWMFFADVGTFTAGYVRTKFPEHAGLYWFHIHQVCMSITWCLSMISVVMMFIKFGSTPLNIVKLGKNPHAIFGLIAMILTFIQPIMGFLRPGPLSIYRRHFNVIHRFTGYITTCFSLMAILSASFLPEAMLKTVSIIVSGSFVVFYILCHLFLRFVKRKGLTEMVSLGYFLCIGGIFSFMIGFMYVIIVS